MSAVFAAPKESRISPVAEFATEHTRLAVTLEE
jgi:hypothetical protein